MYSHFIPTWKNLSQDIILSTPFIHKVMPIAVDTKGVSAKYKKKEEDNLYFYY